MTHPALLAGAAALRALKRFQLMSQRDAEEVARVVGDAMLAALMEPSGNVRLALSDATLAHGETRAGWRAGIDAVRREIQEDR